jgi:hypothetical protein
VLVAGSRCWGHRARGQAEGEGPAGVGTPSLGAQPPIHRPRPVLLLPPPGTNEACDLFVVGETFETFSLAFAFPAGFPPAAISDLNEAIVRLQTQQGALDSFESTCARPGAAGRAWRRAALTRQPALRASGCKGTWCGLHHHPEKPPPPPAHRYIKTGGTDKCFTSHHASGSHASGSQIELRQVSGLWCVRGERRRGLERARRRLSVAAPGAAPAPCATAPAACP